MSIRGYITILIAVAAVGGISLVLGLTYAYYNVEAEQFRQKASEKSLSQLEYVKEDFDRLFTTGDLIFGGQPNSYLAQPGIKQITQIQKRLLVVEEVSLIPSFKFENLQTPLTKIKGLFQKVHQNKLDGNELVLFDQSTTLLLKHFRTLYSQSKSKASLSLTQLSQKKSFLKTLAYILGLAYLLPVSYTHLTLPTICSV